MKWMLVIILSIPFIGHSQHSVSFLNTQLKTLDHKTRKIENNSRIPFEIIRGMMYVKASVDDQEGNFIIDTGSPLLILNQKSQSKNEIIAKSISTSFSVSNLKVDKFNWAGIEYKNLKALAADISHLSKASKQEVSGIIGYNFLKGYEFFIDSERKELRLFQSNRKSPRQTVEPLLEIPMALYGHLPVITFKINGKKYRFGLDTGAAVNLIDSKIFEQLTEEVVQDLHQEEVQGVDQSIKRVDAATLTNGQIGSIDLADMKFLSTDFSEINHDTDLQIDGLLGYPFFKQLKCSINYKRAKLYIWSLIEDPQEVLVSN